jgi:hypothetical protein
MQTMARRVHFYSANRECNAEDLDCRRARGTTMDPARAPLVTVGCTAQIELGEVAREEWKLQMHRGHKRRDVRGFGRSARSRRDDEGWRAIYRHRRLHPAHFGDGGAAASTLDSQNSWPLLTALLSREVFRVDVDRTHRESGDESSW